MSAWDLTCRPPASATIRANELSPTGATYQVGRQHYNDRPAKMKHKQQQQQQQQIIIPFALTPATPLVWAINSNANTIMAPSEQSQALLTTATSDLDQRPTTQNYLCSNPDGLAQRVNWLEALRKQRELARRCQSVMVAAGAPVLGQQSLGSTKMLASSQCNSGQSSASSSPGSLRESTTGGSTVESVDLTLTAQRYNLTQQTIANKPQRSSSSMSFSSSSSSTSSSVSTSSATSFDGDYTLVPGENNSPALLNLPCEGGGESSNCRVDRRARKKDQNRRAAYNYRRKKMEERDRMIEEEARLVHKHVRLAGKIARIDEKILTMMGTKTAKISDANGYTVYHLCPVCMKSCANIMTLRHHIKTQHQQRQLVPIDNCMNTSTSESSPWARPLDHTMSATEDGLGDFNAVIAHDSDEDNYPDSIARDMPNRDRGIQSTMLGGDVINRDDDDSSTF